MTRGYPGLDRLASEQHGVLTRAQLVGLGVARTTLERRCSPAGPWQSPLPRIVVLHKGPLSVAQRYWGALLYGAGRGGVPTMITGVAALALYRLRAAPAPEDVRTFDVLVPHERHVTSLPIVRAVRTRRLPRPVRMQHRLSVAPLLRAAVDAVRLGVGGGGAGGGMGAGGSAGQGREWEGVLYEVVQARRVAPEALAAELRAERLTRRAGVREVLDDLRVGVRSPAEARARRVLEGPGAEGLPRPLWNVRLWLDGTLLAVPDAYWPDHGVLFEVDSVRHHWRVEGWEATMARHNRIEAVGLKVLHASPRQLRERPEAVLADLRRALAGGPYGPWDRVRVER